MSYLDSVVDQAIALWKNRGEFLRLYRGDAPETFYGSDLECWDDSPWIGVFVWLHTLHPKRSGLGVVRLVLRICDKHFRYVGPKTADDWAQVLNEANYTLTCKSRGVTPCLTAALLLGGMATAAYWWR